MVNIARMPVNWMSLWLLVVTQPAMSQALPGELSCACSIHPDGQLENLVLNGRTAEQHPSFRSSVIDPVQRMLVIRVDFKDLPGPPKSNTRILDSEVITKVGATVSDYFEEVSYGKVSLSLESKDVTPVLRMPETAEYYASSPVLIELMPAAYRAANEAGYRTEDYRFIGIVFSSLREVPNSKVSYHGWAYIRGSTSWYNGSFEPGIVAHELGHSLGLNHANRWQASDPSNPIDPNGQSVDYGDYFDIMGNYSIDDEYRNHFNPASLSQLGWLPASAIRQTSRSGLFRLYRFDHREADLERIMAVEVPINATQSYWIGYRHKYDQLRDGVVLVRSDGRGRQTQLLDLKPGGAAQDVALGTGQSFVDPDLGMVLSVGRTGGGDGNEYVEFTVKMLNQTAEVPSLIAFKSSSHFVAEDAGHVTLTLVRDRATNEAVSVEWATVPGTATDQDFAMASGQVAWAAGDQEDKTFEVTIFADDAVETIETFAAVLSTPTGALLGEDKANVSIIDVPAETTVDDADEEAEIPNENIVPPTTTPGDNNDTPDSLPSTPNDVVGDPPSIDPADDPIAIPEVDVSDVGPEAENPSSPENGPTHNPLPPPSTENTQGESEDSPQPTPSDNIPPRPASDDQAQPGWVSFGMSVMTVPSGANISIPFTRVSGNEGAISVHYTVHKLDENGLPDVVETLSGEVQWADGEASPKTVRWQVPHIASSWDQFEWRLTDASEEVRFGTYPSLIVERQQSNSRQTWRLEQFGEAVSEDDAFSHEVDFDQDSVSNLIEYALGRSPQATGGSDGPLALPKIGVTIKSSNGKPHLFIDLDLPSPARDDLIYEVCASDGSASETVIARKVGVQLWSNADSGADLIEQAQRPSFSNGRQNLRVVDTKHLGETERRFLFLRVVLN